MTSKPTAPMNPAPSLDHNSDSLGDPDLEKRAGMEVNDVPRGVRSPSSVMLAKSKPIGPVIHAMKVPDWTPPIRLVALAFAIACVCDTSGARFFGSIIKASSATQ